jgi:hypothetical protein
MMDECMADTPKTPTSLTKAPKNKIYIRPTTGQHNILRWD